MITGSTSGPVAPVVVAVIASNKGAIGTAKKQVIKLAPLPPAQFLRSVGL
jgi:hypothetical protein